MNQPTDWITNEWTHHTDKIAGTTTYRWKNSYRIELRVTVTIGKGAPMVWGPSGDLHTLTPPVADSRFVMMGLVKAAELVAWLTYGQELRTRDHGFIDRLREMGFR